MIKGNGFNIRHVEEEDLDKFIQLMNDLVIRGEFLPSLITSPHKIRHEYKENGLSTDSFERLLIVDINNKIIGTIWHFKSVPYFNAREIGYTLFDIEQRGTGIISQAVTLLTSYLFNGLDINRLEIRMDTNNLASEKVAIKCGFQKEGISRAANYVKGKNVDMFIYSLLRVEWQSGI